MELVDILFGNGEEKINTQDPKKDPPKRDPKRSLSREDLKNRMNGQENN